MAFFDAQRFLFRSLRGLRDAAHSGEPSLVTRHGKPSLLVVPFDTSLEAQALTRSPVFLEDIDRTEYEIAEDKMTPLNDALAEVGVEPDYDTADVSVEVGAAMEAVVAGWLSSQPESPFAKKYAFTTVSGTDSADEYEFLFEPVWSRWSRLKSPLAHYETDRRSPKMQFEMTRLSDHRTGIKVYFVSHDQHSELIEDYRRHLHGSLSELKLRLEARPHSKP